MRWPDSFLVQVSYGSMSNGSTLLPTAERQIGILFQDALLFDQFSVGQNLLLASAGGTQRMLQGAMR